MSVPLYVWEMFPAALSAGLLALGLAVVVLACRSWWVARRLYRETVYDVTSALFRLGLLNKNGGKYSLKQL